MATNQVKDSKNNNAQYGASFDSEKADAKTISEMSKKADSGDALLFANKMTNKDTAGNGNKDGLFSSHSDSSNSGKPTFLPNTDGNKPAFPFGGFDGNKGGSFGNVGQVVSSSGVGNSSAVPESKGDVKIKDSEDSNGGENQRPGIVSHGNVILDTIAAQRTYVAPIEAASTIRDIGVEVANEILATREALNAKQEVRIMLKDSVLRDTEVFVVKDGKSLSVSFVTGASESADILNQRSGDLRAQLMEKLDDVDFVDIQVEDNSQSNADNQNQDGRSQNRFGNEDQSQDNDQ